MIFYSQKSFPQKLGTCTTSIKSNGCFLVSLTNLLNYLGIHKINPLELNALLMEKKGYSSGCLMNAPVFAKELEMTYVKTNSNPKNTCIAETDNFKKLGVPQHFFLIRKDGMIIDPLDLNPKWKKNPYHIVSWRVFTKTETPQSLTSPKIEAQPQPVAEVIPEPQPVDTTPKQDEIIAIPVTLNPQQAPNNSTANPVSGGSYTIGEYKPAESWMTKLINLILKLWNK